jgi:ubiquinone/menaquinone biosynthesis C-methylase UbiE
MSNELETLTAAAPDVHRQFWSKIADKFDHVVDLQMGAATRSMIRDRTLKESELGRLVEFGCGTGYYTQTLVEIADSVVAMDLSPGMLDLARKRVMTPNVSFEEQDCHATDFEDESFDSAFIGLVLHFTRPRKVLREIHRILAPGGTLIIANLDLKALRGFTQLRARVRVIYHGLNHYGIKTPLNLSRGTVSGDELRRLLEECNFRVVAMETVVDCARSSNIPMNYVKAIKM